MPDPDRKRQERVSPGRSTAATIFLALLFLMPFAIGLGFGYLAWTHGKRLDSQRLVDKAGIAVTAVVEATRIQIVRHQSTRVGGGERTTPEPSRFCHIAVSYKAPGSAQPWQKQFKFEDDTICDRYGKGDTIQGKLLADNPAIMVLDEGRLDTFWYWLTLTLFALFAGVPTLALLRGLTQSRR